MSQSLKAVLGASIVIGLIGCVTWLPDIPGTWHRTARWIALAMVLLPIPVLVWANKRSEKAPEFLWKLGATPFERDGFCFLIVPEKHENKPCLTIHYQNQYGGRCEATVGIGTTWTLFSKYPNIKGFSVGLKLQPGEYGFATFAVPFPPNIKGKTASLDVSASVKYPDGRGKLLRFRNGLEVGAADCSFWKEGLQALGAAAGSLIFTQPARMKLSVPFDGDSAVTEVTQVRSRSIWSSQSS